jgi:diguanylate cyclase (GGDEF)-like protein
VPIVLYSQGKQCSETVLSKAEVLFTPMENAQQVVENRIQRALAYSKLQVVQTNSQLVDEASGLYSYAYFVRRLQDEMALAKRHNTAFSCVVIKFAFYEAYLDSYGYQFIEKLYARLAERIRNVIRQEDIAARLGNDEMALLLPRTPEKGAQVLAKRLLENVIRLEIDASGTQAEDVFVFAGIVEYPSLELADADPDTLLRFNRHALHQARNDETEPVQLFSAMRPSAGTDKPNIEMLW